MKIGVEAEDHLSLSQIEYQMFHRSNIKIQPGEFEAKDCLAQPVKLPLLSNETFVLCSLDCM